MDKVGIMQEPDGQYKLRDENPQKEPRRSASNKNTVTEMKNALDGFISRLYTPLKKNLSLKTC